MKQLISERGINIHIRPIIGAKGKKFNNEYIREGFNKTNNKREIIFRATKESRWDLYCYKLMDIIATEIRQKFDNICINHYGSIAKQMSHPIYNNLTLLSKPDTIYEFESELNLKSPSYLLSFYTQPITISQKRIINLMQCNANILLDTIEKIKNFSFKCKYKFKSEKNSLMNGVRPYGYSYEWSNLNNEKYNKIFSDIKQTPEKIGIDGKIYNRSFEFHFSTIIGVLFNHNIFTGAYTLIEEPFYSLSKNSHLLYRMKFFPYGKLKNVNLNRDIILHDLGINTPNPTYQKKIFLNMVDELNDLKLIKIIKISKDYKLAKVSYNYDLKENKVVKISEHMIN